MSNSSITAVSHLDSDYEKGRLLSAIPAAHLGESRVRTSFLAVTRMHRVRLRESPSPGCREWRRARRGFHPDRAWRRRTTIGSAYERSRVLQAVTKSAPAGRDLDPLYFEAATGIDSDYEKGRVLTTYAQHGSLATRAWDALRHGGDDHVEQRPGESAAGPPSRAPISVGARCAGYLAAASHIDSDYDKARALLALQGAAVLTPRAPTPPHGAAGSIQSSNDRARVLVDFGAAAC
jgi:hypothetical protein